MNKLKHGFWEDFKFAATIEVLKLFTCALDLNFLNKTFSDHKWQHLEGILETQTPVPWLKIL